MNLTNFGFWFWISVGPVGLFLLAWLYVAVRKRLRKQRAKSEKSNK